MDTIYYMLLYALQSTSVMVTAATSRNKKLYIQNFSLKKVSIFFTT